MKKFLKISGIIHASHKLFKMEDSTSALDVLPQNCTKNVPKPAVRAPAFRAALPPCRRMADKGRSARADRPSPHFDDLSNRRPFSSRRAAYFCCAASFAFSSFCIRQAITTNAMHAATIGTPKPKRTAASTIVILFFLPFLSYPLLSALFMRCRFL